MHLLFMVLARAAIPAVIHFILLFVPFVYIFNVLYLLRYSLDNGSLFSGNRNTWIIFQTASQMPKYSLLPVARAVKWNEFVKWRYSMSSADASHSFVKNSLFFRPQNKWDHYVSHHRKWRIISCVEMRSAKSNGKNQQRNYYLVQ